MKIVDPQCGCTEEAKESMLIPCVCLRDPALRGAA